MYKVFGKDVIRLTVAVMKPHNQKQLEDERVYLDYISQSTVHRWSQGKKSNWAETWGQDLMQGPGTGAAFWLSADGLFSLLFYPNQKHQPDIAPPAMC